MTRGGDGTARVCALPGCDNLLPPPFDPTKRYCSPEHRRAARRRRRGTTTARAGTGHTGEAPGTAPGSQPAVPSSQPAVPSSQPAVPSSQPAVPSPQPAVPGPQPAMPGPRRDPDHPVPYPRSRPPATTHPPTEAPARAETGAERRSRLRAAAAAERADAAAVLAGHLLPGEAPPTGRRAGRRSRAAPHWRAAVPESVSSAPWMGQTREALVAAVRSLGNNRLRSLLTTVGIVAGVAAVIALVSLGDGMSHQFKTEADKVSNQINIAPARGTVTAGGAPRNLTDADVTALRDRSRAPHITEISPEIIGTVTATAGQTNAKVDMYGVQHNYLRLTDRHIAAGRWFSEAQVTGGERTVVIGPQAVNLLFGPNTDPRTIIGRPIRLSQSTFTIQGAFDTNGQLDNVVAIPFNAARAYLTGNNGGEVDQIIVKSTNINTVLTTVSEIATVLDEQHHIRTTADRDYKVSTYLDSIKKNQDFIYYLSLFTVAIAAISLFVGGVGVANIMLVSVTERTREIGIRKAVGATTSAILRQFLSEAIMLTGLGGLVGVGVGIGITKIAAAVLPHYGAGTPDSSIPIPILSVGPILAAFVISLLIGLVAGVYPAFRAARMRPIEALRFE